MPNNWLDAKRSDVKVPEMNSFAKESAMHRRRLLLAVASVSLLSIVWTGTMRGESPAPLAPFQFLLGGWTGTGDQADATGGFTFAPAVQDRVIVRTNYSNTPPNGGRPASRHDDLMVIFVDAGVVKAEYFDSEDHVIRYVADARPGEVVFLSEIKASEPRYRLTYTRESETTLNGKFDVAPPGKPEAFAPYLSWTARKVK